MSKRLYRQLRNPSDAELRLGAAQALGEQDDLQGAPPLIRAAVEDPDARVRAAAREALLNLIGADTELAIQTYRSAPEDDPWLLEMEEDGESEESDPVSFEDDQYLSGLVTVLRSHADAAMRLKAIQELSQSSDLRVIAALAETVLWTDDRDVRQAARASLEARFGEDTEEIIHTYQVLDEPEEDEDWEEGEDEEEEEANPTSTPQISEPWRAPSVSPPAPQQVLKEEGFPWLLVVIAAVGVVVMLALVLFAG